MKSHYKVTKWVSWQTYVGEKNRSLILNQKSGKYLILNDIASHIWNCIIQSQNMEKFQTYDYEKHYEDVCQILLLEDVIYSSQQAEINNKKVISSDLVTVSRLLDTNFIKWINENGYIFDAHWDITNKCNSQCIHCYNNDAHTNNRNCSCEDELSTREAMKILEQLKKIGVFRLVLSGGEASLRDDFLTICRYARNLGFQLVIYSNGIINQQKRSKLVSLLPYCVAISIYGSISSIHEQITRIKGSYNKSIQSIKYFKKKGISTCYKNTLLKTNYWDWEKAFIKGKEIADQSMVNYTIYPPIDKNSSILDCAMELEQLIELALQKGSPIYYDDKIERACTVNKGEDCHPCYDTTGNIYIAPTGDIYPCIAFPYKIGSFRENKVFHIKYISPQLSFSPNLNIESYEKRLENWRSLKIKDLTDCRKFDYCQFCIDICPGDAFVLHGNLLIAPQNHCIIAKARFTAKCWHNNGGTLDTWKTFSKTDKCKSYIKNCIDFQI